jgi:autotransporter-associated beta strand protein
VILTAANAITSNNDSLALTPVFSTGAATLTALQLSNVAPVITTTGLSPDDLNIPVLITSAGGMITKSGSGSVDLSGANTFTTGFDLNQGSLIFGASTTGTVTNGPVGTGTLQIDSGTSVLSDTAVRTIANPTTVTGSFSFGGVTAANNLVLSGAMNLGASSPTITVPSAAVTATISGVITSTAGAGNAAFTKAGNGILTLSGANTNTTFGGASVTVAGGLLKDGVANAVPNSSLLTVNTGAGFDLNGFGQNSQQIAGGGFITNSAGSAQTLLVGGTSTTDVTTNLGSTFNGAFADNHTVAAASTLAVTKVGVGTLTLGGPGSSNFGATTIVAGGINTTVDNTMSPNSAVIVGNSTTAALTATLDTTNGGALSTSQTIGGLQATDNNGTGSASIVVGTGKTLTVNGPVTLGSNVGTTDVTNVNFTGGGSLVVSNTGGTFQIGGATAANVDTAIVNMSALANFTANMGSAGSFHLGNNNSTNAGTGSANSVLTLAGTSNSISAGTVGIGDLEQVSNAAVAMHMGAGTNAINANTLNISSTSTGRSNGTLDFGGSNGTVSILDFNGDSTLGTTTGVMNLINGADGTGASMVATVNLAGHSANVVMNTITQSARSAGTVGGATSTFSFDTGTLSANTLTMSNRSGTTQTTAIATSTMNIGGGTATFGTVTMAQNSVNIASSTGASTATLNINGNGTVGITTLNMGSDTVAGTGSTGGTSGTVNIGTTIGAPTVGLGAVTMGVDTSASTSATAATSAINIAAGTVTAGAISMGNTSTANDTVNSAISITGGSLTLGGDLTYTNGAGTENTSLTLNGGTLNMGGHNIGSATATVGSGTGSLKLQTGTLENVGQINNGAGFTKSVTGTLIVTGTNTWTGNTIVSAGTLQLNGGGLPTLGATALSITGATTVLNVQNDTTVGNGTAGSISIGAGSTFSMLDNGINALTLSTSGTNGLTMNSGSILSLDFNSNGVTTTIDSANVNDLTLGAGGNPLVMLNALNAATLANGTYSLLTYAAGDTLHSQLFTWDGTNTVEQIGGGRSYTLITGANALQLVVASNAATPAYWNGTINTSWSTLTGANASNWLNGPAGTDLLNVPGSGSDVFFTANSATNLFTTLDAPFTINSLTFTGTGTTAGTTDVFINPGTGGAANTLTINAALGNYAAGTGIVVNTNNAGVNHFINVGVILGASQSWTNNNSAGGQLEVSGDIDTAGNTLTLDGSGPVTLSGSISGTGALVVAETGFNGAVILSGATANTYSGQTTLSSGVLALEKTSGVAVVGDGLASDSVFDIVVSGGTLEWGGNNQLDHSVSIDMTSGQVTMDANETFFDLTTSGGLLEVGANVPGVVVNITEVNVLGGTNSVNAGATANFGTLNIGGIIAVANDDGSGLGGGILNVGSVGGLNFQGSTGLPGLQISSDNTSPGQVVLQGDITDSATVPASITTDNSGSLPGTLDLGGADRTVTTTGSSALLTIAVPITDISGPGHGLNKAGTGTLVLSGANTYTGPTNVNAGKVVVSGSLAGSVNVAAGATLASGNNISSQIASLSAASSSVTTGAIVAPGDTGGPSLTTIGQLNVTGDVSLGSSGADTNAAHLSIEIGGTQDGAGVGNSGPNTTSTLSLQYDRIAMGGTLSLTNVSLDITAVNGYTFTNPSWNNSTQQFNLDGHIFFLITGASGVSGTFSNDSGLVDQNVPGLFTTVDSNGQLFAVSYDASFTAGTFSGGNDVAVMAIPEPNSMSMLAGSLGLALGLQRFRRRRSRSIKA